MTKLRWPNEKNEMCYESILKWRLSQLLYIEKRKMFFSTNIKDCFYDFMSFVYILFGYTNKNNNNNRNTHLDKQLLYFSYVFLCGQTKKITYPRRFEFRSIPLSIC